MDTRALAPINQINNITVGGSVRVDNAQPGNILINTGPMPLSGVYTTTLEWSPSRLHTDAAMSSVTFKVRPVLLGILDLLYDFKTATATFKATPNNVPTSHNVISPATLSEDTTATFTVQCDDADVIHKDHLAVSIVTTSSFGGLTPLSRVNAVGQATYF